MLDDRAETPYVDGERTRALFSFRLVPGSYTGRFEDHRRGNWSGAYTEQAFAVAASAEPVRVAID